MHYFTLKATPVTVALLASSTALYAEGALNALIELCPNLGDGCF